MVLCRYPAFFQRTAWGPSREVAIAAELAAGDRRTVTAGNLAYVSDITKLDGARAGWLELTAALPVKEVADKVCWRLGLLDSLIKEREELEGKEMSNKQIVARIGSLCAT